MLKEKSLQTKVLAFMLIVSLIMPYSAKAIQNQNTKTEFEVLQELIPIAESKGIYVKSSNFDALKEYPEVTRKIINSIEAEIVQNNKKTSNNEYYSSTPILRVPIYERHQTLRRTSASPISVTQVNNPTNQICLGTAITDYYCNEYIDRSSGSPVFNYTIASISTSTSNLANETQFLKILDYSHLSYTSVINTTSKFVTIHGLAAITAQTILEETSQISKNYTGQYTTSFYAGDGYVLQYIN